MFRAITLLSVELQTSRSVHLDLRDDLYQILHARSSRLKRTGGLQLKPQPKLKDSPADLKTADLAEVAQNLRSHECRDNYRDAVSSKTSLLKGLAPG